MVYPRDSITPICSIAVFPLYDGHGGLLVHPDQDLWYTQDVICDSNRAECLNVMNQDAWVCDLFLRTILRGGIGYFHIGEFFLADGADGVGICRHEEE